MGGYIRSHIEFELNILIFTFSMKIREHFWIFEFHKVMQQNIAGEVEIFVVCT